MSILPDGLDEILKENIYKSEDEKLVRDALIRLDVNVSNTFQEFYNRYAGPFWEEHVPFELLDIVDEKNNIESYTLVLEKNTVFLNSIWF